MLVSDVFCSDFSWVISIYFCKYGDVLRFFCFMFFKIMFFEVLLFIFISIVFDKIYLVIKYKWVFE